jgi:ATP-dependent DNA helicase RecG
MEDLQLVRRMGESLPFQLTRAQRRCVSEILRDMLSTHPMQRLLQGDVGSGKTVVILLAMLCAHQRGQQGALLAPTQILAEQHFDTICRFLAQAHLLYEGGDDTNLVRVSLLTASHKPAPGSPEFWDVGPEQADIVIGTHALLEESVRFSNLGLVVIDEQHKFGVVQRSQLISKGDNPDLLVTSATPIPRSLAMTIYGDLDLSVIDELPPDRGEIVTSWVPDESRRQVFDFICRQIDSGRQAYVVTPLIEESEQLVAVKSVMEVAARWAESVQHPEWVAVLHGRLNADDKAQVMERWRQGEVRILVSTTVVEVGVDVPNATIMLILNAERFGLSQLHQLRGRIGRGAQQSFCFLVSKGQLGMVSRQRLSIMENTRNGFEIAEQDLLLRGPGELVGTQQSGHSLFHLADPARDCDVLAVAREEVDRLLLEDPGLAHAPALRQFALNQELYRLITAA